MLGLIRSKFRCRFDSHARARECRRAAGVAALLAAVGCVTAVGVHAEGDVTAGEPPSGVSATLSAIGMDYERALHRTPSERTEALAAVSRALGTVMEAGLPEERRAAARFLYAAIRDALGDYETAASDYEKAARDDDSEIFEDDAAFAAVVALEEAGRDEEAAREWKDWEKHHRDSTLMPEARLRRTWNALRRGARADGVRLLDELQAQYPWMKGDPRVALAAATLAYMNGQPEAALARLGDSFDGPAATYLRGLCYTALETPLKAAAMYQEVVERYPESSLRDLALLAKADIFLASGSNRSAAEEFERVVATASDAEVRAEAELRLAAALYLDGDSAAAVPRFRNVVESFTGSDQAARAQYLLGEVLASQSMYEAAIIEFNRVLTDYFEHSLAATAQYRVGRCLDALGRHADATSTYQAVVSGYQQAAEAPSAAYLAGAGLLAQGRPLDAAPFFQIVLDRYAKTGDGTELIQFASPEHQQLVEAATCLLMLAYYRSGDLGQLSGVPHLMLHRLPPSQSSWRASALLIDADALASQGRLTDAQSVLEGLLERSPGETIGVPASRLLAWTYAQQGKNELAMSTEAAMIEHYGDRIDSDALSAAYLNRAHVLFNQQRYEDAAAGYEDFLARYPDDPQRTLALYQAGLCYMRLDRHGDAVDRWGAIVQSNPDADIAERAWIRAGDLYFSAEHYEEAKASYAGLLEHFAQSEAAALGMLRIAQCEYNAGNDAAALERFGAVIDRFPGTAEAGEAENGIEMALYRLGQSADGATVLADLVERYPGSAYAAEAQFAIAMQSREAGQYLEAAEAFRRLVSQFPAYVDADRAHVLMAECYAEGGAPEDAQNAYEQFLVFFPDSELRPTVRFRLGAQRFDSGDYMRAAIDFTGVLESDVEPEIRSAALFNLALCRRMLGELEPAREALEDYRAQGYLSEGREAEVAFQLGDIHEQSQRYELAVLEYEQALAAPDVGERVTEIHHRIGGCREKLGDTEGAKRAYREAMAGGSKNDPFRLSAVARCAALYEQDGERLHAIEAYRDLAANTDDAELRQAARERADQLESATD
ncbi:MAG: tetratricopeptide repeat protein [Candidatus Eiseniibacteriota bacterium]|jgi:TolA-binding protein